jgi:hypothetical protein
MGPVPCALAAVAEAASNTPARARSGLSMNPKDVLRVRSVHHQLQATLALGTHDDEIGLHCIRVT